MGYHYVSLIQSRIDVARASSKARQMARLNMPEPWRVPRRAVVNRAARSPRCRC